jgi:hypothetical protein
MIVRVVEFENGEVRIMTPLSDGEDAFTSFIGKALAVFPELVGRPFVDIDDSELPKDFSTRSRWRLRDGRIIVTKQE